MEVHSNFIERLCTYGEILEQYALKTMKLIGPLDINGAPGKPTTKSSKDNIIAFI